MRKAIAAAGAGVCVVLALPASAAAHATLVRTSPTDRAVLAQAPRDVRIVFDDVIRVASGNRVVRNSGGSVIAGKPHVLDSRTLVLPLRRIGDGDYTVVWRIVADDGHTEAGVLAFAVGAGRAPPTPSLTASNGPSARDVVSRWLFFAGLLVAAGGALFRIATGAGRVAPLVPAFVAVFLGASGLLPHEGTFASRFGAAYAVAAIVAALGAAAAAVSTVVPRAGSVAWALALALLPLPSFAGHALDAGVPRFDVAADILHLAAAAIWTGGLVQLALLLRRRASSGVLARFSTVALVAVLVLAATGVIRALAELSSVSQLWSTGYGVALVVKTALLGLLVYIGWVNRYRLIPRGDLSVLRVTTAGELLLLAGLAVAVAILTDVRPGIAKTTAVAQAETGPPPLPARDAIVLAREDGQNGVTIAAEPRQTRVTVFNANGLGVNGLDVTIAGTRATACGPGCYARATAARGSVPVVVGGRRLSFVVPRVAPDATSLIERATRAFRSLRSVAYVERLASGPHVGIVSRFTLEAPDRVHYRIGGGTEAIVIGTRRWDRVNSKWIPSTTPILPQPAPIWGTPVTNAHVLARTARTVTVSFLNPSVPAWFDVRFDARTLRPHDLDMIATAHFMHHAYTAFNRPRTIFRP